MIEPGISVGPEINLPDQLGCLSWPPSHGKPPLWRGSFLYKLTVAVPLIGKPRDVGDSQIN
jgi:hypothetical protein